MANHKTKGLTEKGSLGFNNKPNSSRPSTEQYKRSLNSLILQTEISTYVGRFEWKNLPKGITGNLIETMLYYKGQLAFFKTGAKYYILPFVYTGTLNHYGLPEKLLPIPFNGKMDDDKNPKHFIQEPKTALLYNDDEAYEETEIAVVLREHTSLLSGNTIPSIVLTDQVRDKAVEHLILLRNNIILSQPIKYISVDTQDKANSLATQFDNMLHDILNGNVVQTIVGQLRLETTSSETSKMQAQQLWQSFSSINAMRLESLGMLNAGTFEKNERVLEGEIAGKQSVSKLVLKDHLEQRKLFAEMVNRYFNLDVEVCVTEELIEKEVRKENDNRVGPNIGRVGEISDET